MADKQESAKTGIKGAVEDTKGKVKEAAGTLLGDDQLEREGETQQKKADAQEQAAKKEAEAEKARAEAEAQEKRQQTHQ